MKLKATVRDKLLDKSWKKYLLIFIVIFVLITGVGVYAINFMYDTIIDNDVHSTIVVINDKYSNDGDDHNYYFVVTDDNETLSIIDNGDGKGEEIWNGIQIGEKYKITVQNPDVGDLHNFRHIVQVKNATR